MTNDIPTTPLSPEQQNPPKKCKFMPFPDGIRIFALSLFVCAYSLIASFGWISLPFSLEDIFLLWESTASSDWAITFAAQLLF